MSEFEKKTWNTGETITAEDLNRLEETMESVNASVNTLNSYNLDENVLNFGKRQTLSSVQQINARTNIGAMSIEAAEELNRKKLETSYSILNNSEMITLYDAADKLQYTDFDITINSQFGIPLGDTIPQICGSKNNIFNYRNNRTDYGYVSGYYLASNGEKIQNKYFFISEYIIVEPSHTYYIGTLSSRLNTDVTYDSINFPSVVFYDSNKQYISGQNYRTSAEDTNTTISFVTPNNAIYCRFTMTHQNGWANAIYLNNTENTFVACDSIINIYQLPSTIQLRQTKENLYSSDDLRLDVQKVWNTDYYANKWNYDSTKNTIKLTSGYVQKNKNIFSSMRFKSNTSYTFILTFASQKMINEEQHSSWLHFPFDVYYTDGSYTTLENSSLYTTDENNINTLLFTSDANKTIRSIERKANANTGEINILILYLNKCGIFEGTINRSDFKSYDGINTTINVPSIPNTYELEYNLSEGWVIRKKIGITLDGINVNFRAELVGDEFRIGSIKTIVDSNNIICTHMLVFPFNQRYDAPNFTLYQDNEGYLYFKAPENWDVDDVNNLFNSYYVSNIPIIIVYETNDNNKIVTYEQKAYTRYGYSNVYCTNSYINKLTYPVDVFLNLNETWKFHPMIAEKPLAENEYFQINNRLFKIIASGGVSAGSIIEEGMYEETSIAAELNKLYSQEE